jgi:aspartate racemase
MYYVLTGEIKRMSTVSTIGVLGGMGPEATNHMSALITALTPARQDADHIPVITFNNPLIPSRVDAILKGTTSPLPELVRTARMLEAAGADFLIMPCNTAHHYFDEISAEISIPILNMVALTVSEVVAFGFRRVGLLATTATLSTGLYHKRLQETGISVIETDSWEQQEVMQAIFGESGVKAGAKHEASSRLESVGRRLIDNGAQVLLAGCTEVSVAFHGRSFDPNLTVIDPMLITAQAAIALARDGYGTDPMRRRSSKTVLTKFRKKWLHVLGRARKPQPAGRSG